ncbi:MAG: hypothetical protein KBS64_02650 [Treponema sp.]|nr:hypothetical protein [Candidatus Treponema equi]
MFVKFHSGRSYLKKAVSIVAVLMCLLNTVSAAEKSMVLGGKEGWPLLSRMDGIVSDKGKFGYDAMMLATNSHGADQFTDLLLDFEAGTSDDLMDNYSIVENNSVTTEVKACMGKKSALTRGKGGIRLDGKRTSLFGKEGPCGSFMIEFWLNPSIAENGEVVFSWRSSRTVANYPLYQMITGSFSGNHLEWSFTNVFNGYVEDDGEITLSSYRTIVPDQWMHHAISFDENTGLLEYRINGLLEDLKYVTTNGHETGGSIYIPILGVPADIEICPQYAGLIDDFRIQRQARPELLETKGMDTYRIEGGRFETQPLLLSTGAEFTGIDALVNMPSQTDIQFYVRSGDSFYNWTDSYPEWIPIKNHKKIENIKGLYFQVACELLPDGAGKKSPSVTELKIKYKEVPSPLPPFELKAFPGDGEVTLSWPYSVDDTVGGYYIFYGERPGEYLGREAVEGTSPIDAGCVTSVTLSGLKNGRIYYFAVASYSKYDNRIMGELSKEIFTRPKRK